MKLATIAVTVAVATSTINALERCNLSLLESITNSDEAKLCGQESEFTFLLATVTGTPPKQKQHAAICKSVGCQAVIQKLYAAVPTDCTLIGGKNLKLLTEEVVKACPAANTTTGVAPVLPVVAAAPVADSEPAPTAEDSEAAPKTNASEPAPTTPTPEAPLNATPVVMASALTTNVTNPASEPAPANDDSEPASDASEPAPVIVAGEAPPIDASEPGAEPAPEEVEPKKICAHAAKSTEVAPALDQATPIQAQVQAPVLDDLKTVSDSDASEPTSAAVASPQSSLVIVASEPAVAEPTPASDESEPAPTTASESAPTTPNVAPDTVASTPTLASEPAPEPEPAPATEDSEPAPATEDSEPAPATEDSEPAPASVEAPSNATPVTVAATPTLTNASVPAPEPAHATEDSEPAPATVAAPSNAAPVTVASNPTLTNASVPAPGPAPATEDSEPAPATVAAPSSAAPITVASNPTLTNASVPTPEPAPAIEDTASAPAGTSFTDSLKSYFSKVKSFFVKE